MSRFWRDQPAPAIEDPSGEVGPAVGEAPLPPGFGWREFDHHDERDLADLADLLARHYGRDADRTGTLGPPQPGVSTLRWLLGAPGGDPSWCFGLTDAEDRLVGSIAGLRHDLELDGEFRKAVLVTLLCLDPGVRSRHLAPCLIAELTRRVNARGIVSALFTSRRAIPVAPLGLVQTLAYPLRPKRLAVLGWGDPTAPLGATELDDTTRPSERLGLAPLPSRPLRRADLPVVAELLESELGSARLRPCFDLPTLEHWLLGSPTVEAFVVPSSDDTPLALGSFYHLASARRPASPHSNPAPVFWFYQAAGSQEVVPLWSSLLDRAHAAGADLLLAPDGRLDPGDQRTLGFLSTDGLLGYHLFNWPHDSLILQPSEIVIAPL